MVIASVIVPTYKGSLFITNLLESLGWQSFDDFEAVIVVKPSGDGTEDIVRKKCRVLGLPYKILFQHEGYLTHALNMGIRNSNGDILLFTDDDAILPKDWVINNIKRHVRFQSCGAISGGRVELTKYRSVRSAYFAVPFFKSRRRLRTGELASRMMRSLRWGIIGSLIDKPHPIFSDYRLGVFITRRFRVAKGPNIFGKICLSLPYFGTNMSFKREAIENVLLPEHPMIRIAPYWEQYLGVSVVLQGWEALYDPEITVYHVEREGVSAFTNEVERRMMSLKLEELINQYNRR